jgi:hypothetical protein
MKTLNILNISGDITSILVITGIAILIFLAIREIMCWYWKINITVEELKKANKNLETLISLNRKTDTDANAGLKAELIK